jgi:hypothetical protein
LCNMLGCRLAATQIITCSNISNRQEKGATVLQFLVTLHLHANQRRRSNYIVMLHVDGATLVAEEKAEAAFNYFSGILDTPTLSFSSYMLISVDRGIILTCFRSMGPPW